MFRWLLCRIGLHHDVVTDYADGRAHAKCKYCTSPVLYIMDPRYRGDR